MTINLGEVNKVPHTSHIEVDHFVVDDAFVIYYFCIFRELYQFQITKSVGCRRITFTILCSLIGNVIRRT